MKRAYVFSLLLIFSVFVTFQALTGCGKDTSSSQRKGLVLPDSTSDAILSIISENSKLQEQDKHTESELPPEDFIGTVIEEHSDYLIIEPNEDEKEYDTAKKIRIDFIKEHKDYLYGEGRRVRVSYIPHIKVIDETGYIETDLIDTNGFDEFTLSPIYGEKEHATFVLNNNELYPLNSDYNLYYFGLDDVHVTVDGKTLPLASALRLGKVTLDGIISQCRTYAALDVIDDAVCKDGSSRIYYYDDFTIIKYQSPDGKSDLYIGKKGMDEDVYRFSSHFFVGVYMDYGLSLLAKDVTPTGLVLVYEKTNTSQQSGRLQFGDEYALERLNDGEWQKVPYSEKAQGDTIVWHLVAHIINDFTPYTEHKVDWSHLYGELSDGSYRLKKKIRHFRSTSDYDDFDAYCYFEIKHI